MAPMALACGRSFTTSRHGVYVPATSGESRRSPNACTATSTIFARCSLRYSTCTPAPPYTSGGNSRVSSAAFNATALRTPTGRDDLSLADDDDAVVGNREAGGVELEIEPDARARRHAHV